MDLNEKNSLKGNSEYFLKVPRDPIYRRVAKFLLLIGVEQTVKILPHLTPAQTEKLVPEIASIRSVDKTEAVEILKEFQTLLKEAEQAGGIQTAKTILEKAFGKQQATKVLHKTLPFPEGKPFFYLSDTTAEKLSKVLQGESIPVQTLVLSHVKPSLAAGVIKTLQADQKKEVILRLAKMQKMSPEVIRQVDSAIKEKFFAIDSEVDQKIDGKQALTDILKKMNVQDEQAILGALQSTNPSLSAEIQSQLFTKDDVLQADNRFLQNHLQLMSEKDIALLIAGQMEDFRQKILTNLSRGRGDSVLEEEMILKPILQKTRYEVEQKFMATLRTAWEEGKLYIEGRSEDYV